MSTHDEHIANILLYLDNELRGQELEYLLAHLGNCTDCRRLLEEERALSNLLHRTRPLYTAPESLRARIAAAAGQPQQQLAGTARLEYQGPRGNPGPFSHGRRADGSDD